MLLASRQLLKAPDALEALLREIEVPLLLLGDGFGRGDTQASPSAVGRAAQEGWCQIAQIAAAMARSNRETPQRISKRWLSP